MLKIRDKGMNDLENISPTVFSVVNKLPII